MEAHCLPILQYCTAAIKLSCDQVNELNIGWNSVYRKIFGFQKWESVKQFINGLGRLDFVRLRYFAILKLCKVGLHCENRTFSFLMKMFYQSNCFKLVCSASGLSYSDYCNLNILSVGKMKYCVHNSFNVCLI